MTYDTVRPDHNDRTDPDLACRLADLDVWKSDLASRRSDASRDIRDACGDVVVIARDAGHLRASLFVGVLLLLLWLTIMPFQWVTLFGDLPAAMLGALAVLIYSQAPQRPRAVALASIVFGLAVLTKLLAALLFLPLGVWLLYRAIFCAPRRQNIQLLIVSGVCAAVPLIAFEVGKLLTIGPVEYLDILSRTLDVAAGIGTLGKIPRGIMETVTANAEEFRRSYTVSPWLLIGISSIGLLLVQRSRSPEWRRAYALFAAGALLNWFWFLTISTGFSRYILIGLAFDAAAMSVLVGSFANFYNGATALLAVFVHVASLDRGLEVMNAALDHGFEEEPRIANLKGAVDLLQKLPANTVIIGSWWGATRPYTGEHR